MNKIGWQKYEDILERQLESPLFDAIVGKVTEDHQPEESYIDSGDTDGLQETVAVPVDDTLMESIALTVNFDCWMAHTNFDLTSSIKDILNEVEGIEILKICSRYRFFIGIGQMFDFKEVRQNIENALDINQGEEIE